MNRYFLYAQTIIALVGSDLIVFKKNLHNRIIDNFIHVAANLIVMGYILPRFGLSTDFGLFILASLLSTTVLFDTYPLIANLVSDISGEKKISYDLLLPMPSWLAFARIVITASIQNCIICIATLPFGALFFIHELDFGAISIASLLSMIIMSSIFAGSFGLMCASFTKNMNALSTIWNRFIFPLWYFGGFQFSWTSSHAVFPIASYINLLNPILYTTEGLRDAILGASGPQGPYISAAMCFPVLIGFTALYTWIAVVRFKRRLDFV